MNSDKLQKARMLIKNKPYLIWYSKNYKNLSPESVFEAVIGYGDWEEFIKLQQIFGMKTLKLLFNKAVNRNRSNIRPESINYFKKYFARYA